MLCKEFQALPSQIKEEDYEELMEILYLRRFAEAKNLIDRDGDQDALDDTIRVDVWVARLRDDNERRQARGLEPTIIDEIDLRMPLRKEPETYGPGS